MRQLKRIVKFIATGTLLIIGVNAKADSLPPKPSILDRSQQLLVVVTNSWDNQQAILQPFYRRSSKESWQPYGDSWPVVVGKNGLGWGNNLKSYAGSNDPIKKEGDGKAPAGAFQIGPAFGFEPIDKEVKFKYIAITPSIICVDDPKSRYYGRIINTDQVDKKDWDSAENMVDETVYYKRGLVVNYNIHGEFPGGGSCIFIHIHPTLENGTAGCTAMVEDNLAKIWSWLNPQNNPVLVQFPKEQYQKLQKSWGLPDLPKT